MDDIFFFLCEYVKLILGVFEPGVAEYLDGAESLPGVHLQYRVNQVDCMLTQLGLLLWLRGSRGRLAILVLRLVVGVGVVHIILAIDDKVMQLLHARGLEGHSAYEHGVETHTGTPHVHLEALIALVLEDLRGYVSGGPALLTHALGV